MTAKITFHPLGKASHAVEMTRPRSVQLVDALVCNAS